MPAGVKPYGKLLFTVCSGIQAACLPVLLPGDVFSNLATPLIWPKRSLDCVLKVVFTGRFQFCADPGLGPPPPSSATQLGKIICRYYA